MVTSNNVNRNVTNKILLNRYFIDVYCGHRVCIHLQYTFETAVFDVYIIYTMIATDIIVLITRRNKSDAVSI